ncbi:AAA family ATPase [Proteus penneri]|uniref:Putative ABC transporter ATP-binding protein YbbL n=1 Tax=Proteus penneri TaxID=102862 RepID=A0A0G4PZR2_9GAMM|nr:AAA family ATPase [Proteus penneri]CRL59065.1 putative ABC transporter ATP-binding protein YbbL [Proteus penneri]
MNIKSVQFLDLFDKLNYNLDFSNFDTNILTGPNGYGKTIILKSINSLINRDLPFFEKLRFKEFRIIFDSIDITLKKDEHLQIKITQGDITDILIFEKNLTDIKLSDNTIVTEMEIKWSKMKAISASRDAVIEKLGKYLSGCTVLFIKDQRMQVYIDKKNEITLISLARDLKEKINFAIEEYNRLSQELDATFPIRLFDYEARPSYIMIEEKLKGLKLVRYDYIKFGFLDESTNTKFEMQDMDLSKKYDNAHVLELYLSDSLDKYSAFKDLTKKINLFIRFLNSKELAFKSLVVHKDVGFCLIDNDTGKSIELNSLSSGEQNQIIMLYNLIFLTNKNSILLIDEPEISLHIAWQKEVLNNLERIMKVNNIPQTIIATHSPTVINGNWDRSLDLYELSKQGNN